MPEPQAIAPGESCSVKINRGGHYSYQVLYTPRDRECRLGTYRPIASSARHAFSGWRAARSRKNGSEGVFLG